MPRVWIVGGHFSRKNILSASFRSFSGEQRQMPLSNNVASPKLARSSSAWHRYHINIRFKCGNAEGSLFYFCRACRLENMESKE
jgi:hypothetical protein